MDPVESAYEDIKSLRVQGARNVVKRALDALLEMARTYSGNNFREDLEKAVERLVSSRPTEPALREALLFVLRNAETPKEVEDAVKHFRKRLREMAEKIAFIGANLIEDGMVILTHCHSSTLDRVFERAAKEKEFKVIITETRPLYQGRILARKLSKMGVKGVFIVDSAAYHFMEDADMYMTGADAISADGKVINKIGTALIALAAKRFSVPYYVVASSLKFDPVTALGFKEPIEERSPKEVWESPPEGISVRNPAFDATPPDLITAIVTELGVFPPHMIGELIVHRYNINIEAERRLSLLSLIRAGWKPTL